MSVSKLSNDLVNRVDRSKSIESADYRKRTTSFSDPAMGEHMILLNEAIVKIINTPEFGRLHSIKQTGGCYFVYPSAKHARFEHSLGTCYLASKVVQSLRENQLELGITDCDILAVEIAALCHDLGHGPFSQLFDQLFIPLARPKYEWKHENASIAMFRHMLQQNADVKAYLEQYLDEADFTFIEEAIVPVDETSTTEWLYKGRPIQKAFLYDIVSNKSHGFDVDKWDYFLRDGVHLSIPTSANLTRLHSNLRVLTVEGRPTICYRDKVQQDLVNLATTRAQLHSAACQHRAVKLVEVMLVDAMLIADKHLLVPGTNGAKVCLSQSIDDMAAYCFETDDAVFGDIQRSTSEELKPAREIVQRILKRQLYAKVGRTDVSDPEVNEKFGSGICKTTSAQIAAGLCMAQDQYPSVDKDRLERNLAVVIADIHCGMRDENPVEKVWFYRKDEIKYPEPFQYSKIDYFGGHHRFRITPRSLSEGSRVLSRRQATWAFSWLIGFSCSAESSRLPLPAHYAPNTLKPRAPPPRQKIMWVFCREDDAALVKCATHCFEIWCLQNGLPSPKDVW